MTMIKEQTLGQKVQLHLQELGIETPMRNSCQSKAGAQQHIERYVFDILGELNLDLRDDSLHRTPYRVAKMFVDEIFYGLDYANFPIMTTVENKMRYDEMITVKCQVKSMCEHHFQPFLGTAYVAYIPNTKVLGLSKFNRLVDFFSRRPQIQERLTEQVSAALRLILETEDVAVVISAEHLCVKLRGVQDEQSKTTTSKLSGRFRSVDALRGEFLALTRT